MRLVKQELDAAIVASDPDATCTFYRDILGFAELPSMPLGPNSLQRRFRIGNHWVKVNQLPEPPARESGGTDVAFGIRLLAFYVDDLPAIVARLDAAGKKHVALAVPGQPDIQVRIVKDPEGNVVELISRGKPYSADFTARMQIGLTVSNAEKMRHFFGQQLGLPEEPTMALGGGRTRYAFTWGKTTVKFWQAEKELPFRTGGPNKRAGIRLYTVIVEDIDDVCAELKQKDVAITMEPRDFPGIARIMFAADPDGNWIEFAQRFAPS